jgi:diguanylate cyclase (GGDEF)-like protein
MTVAYFYALGWCWTLHQRLAAIEATTKTDPLTGVGSATWLESERWYAALRSGLPLCVAWFDLDGLKLRNDSAGHAAGDQMIKQAAKALTLASRRGRDEVFRLHTKGDEFLVLLHGPLDPTRVARVFLDVLRRCSVRASGGLAYSTETRYLPARTELRTMADTLCRQAKARGGDCVIVVDRGQQSEVYRQMPQLPTGSADPSRASAECGTSPIEGPFTAPGDAGHECHIPSIPSEAPAQVDQRRALRLVAKTVHP